MKKIKAFTILELMVVMVITSFVTLAGYFAYNSSVVGLNAFQSASQQITDLAGINTLLMKDFNDCISVSLTSNKQCTLHYRDEDIIYVFDDEYIFRKHDTSIDTFNLKVDKVDSKELSLNPLFITELGLTVNSYHDGFVLVYTKEYDSSFFMNMENL